MRGLLDNEPLSGSYPARIAIRPWRAGQLIRADNRDSLLAAIRFNCQVWGGAGSPLLPVGSDNRVMEPWASRLRGGHIDFVPGLDLANYTPDTICGEVSEPLGQFLRHQFAPTFFDDRQRKDAAYLPVTIEVLADDDPWKPIYAASLGLWPESPDVTILEAARLRPDLTFEDFTRVERVEVEGSALDLIRRLSEVGLFHPRQASILGLAMGMESNRGIRGPASEGELPGGRRELVDAGPNVLVICRKGSVEDAALLWNLRAAYGNQLTVPIGLLEGEFELLDVENLLDGHVSYQGIPHRRLYATSASITHEEIESFLFQSERLRDAVAVVTADKLATFGPAPSRPRSEVTAWNSGSTTIVPVSPEDRATLQLRGRRWSDLHLRLGVQLDDAPLPAGDVTRFSGLNDDYFAGYCSRSAGDGVEGVRVQWPTTMLLARAVAAERGLDLAVSNAGLACTTLLESIGENIYMLAHEPLLNLLHDMAQREGTAWGKAHLRKLQAAAVQGDPDALMAAMQRVAPTEDDLPQVPFDRFQKALGSTKAARNWLDWAERTSVVVKGFPIKCESCRASQWVPVNGFLPPLTCRGCGRPVDRPFPKDTVTFKYRLGEGVRRVIEEDAIGHLLAFRYFSIFMSYAGGSALVGARPGLDVMRAGTEQRLSEADVLLLDRSSSFMPVEVKRSFDGMNEDEVRKLDALAEGLQSPWSAVAVPQWAENAPETFIGLAKRNGDGPHRVLLTYEHLLDPSPLNSMGLVPHAWQPMTRDEIEEREESFKQRMESLADDMKVSWEETWLLESARPGANSEDALD